MSQGGDHGADLSADDGLPGPLNSGAEALVDLPGCLMPPTRLGFLGSIGGFDVVKVLGAGGMGIVFEAIAPRGDSAVAIKTLRPQWRGNKELTQRFLREADHMRSLEHPRLVKVLEVGRQSENLYFVMPMMSGGSLRDHIDRDCGMPAERALRIALQVGEGLAYAHQHALIHRDLKPSNILLDEAGDAYLADFGLVRGFYDESIVDPGAGSRAGTPAYMSPKTAAGEPESISGDIYAFGAVLYEMLSGKPPYTGRSHEQILYQIKAAPPTPLAGLKNTIPRPLIRVVEGAMARRLRDRYAEMGDVLADLKRIDAGQKPIGPHGSAIPAARSRPKARLIAASVAILGIAIPGFLLLRAESGSRLEARVLPIDKPAGAHYAAGALADIDGDGQQELVLVAGNRLIANSLSTDAKQEHAFELPQQSKMHIRGTADTDGDGSEELILAIQTPQQARLSLFAWPDKVLGDYTLEGTHYATAEGYFENTVIDFCYTADLDDDGKWELIASYADGYAKKERGLACFNIHTGETLWTHPIAPAPDDAVVTDLDRDKKLDIVAGTYSHSTGLSMPDPDSDDPDATISDDVAYLYGLRHDGTLLWRQDVNAIYAQAYPFREPMPGQHFIATKPRLYDLDGDGRDEIITVIRGADHWRPEIGSVHRIDPATGKPTHSYTINKVIRDDYAVDLDRDGKLELLITDVQGRLHVLDHRLRKQRVIDFAPPTHDTSNLWFAGHFTAADGSPRIVLHGMQSQNISVTNPRTDRGPRNIRHYHNARVVITDASLEPLDTYVLAKKLEESPGFKAQIISLPGDNQPAILSLVDRVRLFHINKRSIGGK